MSHGSRRGFRGHKNRNFEPKKRSDTVEVDEQNPIISSFRNYAREIDAKHDRYERILKIGRDITIESKRIIFLLHTIDPKKNNKQAVLAEAQTRIGALFETQFRAVAKELDNFDPYQYARAFSPGLQEFVEALSFYLYLNNEQLKDWSYVAGKLVYVDKKKIEKDPDQPEDIPEVEAEEKPQTYTCLVQPMEFMLGLTDVGGEIMRRCINSLGSGDVETCFDSCKNLQHLYKGFLGITYTRCRELSRKIYTLKQSVLKAENVCYNVKVRGGEAAKWGSEDPYNTTDKADYDEDEGIY